MTSKNFLCFHLRLDKDQRQMTSLIPLLRVADRLGIDSGLIKFLPSTIPVWLQLVVNMFAQLASSPRSGTFARVRGCYTWHTAKMFE